MPAWVPDMQGRIVELIELERCVERDSCRAGDHDRGKDHDETVAGIQRMQKLHQVSNRRGSGSRRI